MHVKFYQRLLINLIKKQTILKRNFGIYFIKNNENVLDFYSEKDQSNDQI